MFDLASPGVISLYDLESHGTRHRALAHQPSSPPPRHQACSRESTLQYSLEGFTFEVTPSQPHCDEYLVFPPAVDLQYTVASVLSVPVECSLCTRLL